LTVVNTFAVFAVSASAILSGISLVPALNLYVNLKASNPVAFLVILSTSIALHGRAQLSRRSHHESVRASRVSAISSPELIGKYTKKVEEDSKNYSKLPDAIGAIFSASIGIAYFVATLVSICTCRLMILLQLGS